jgi:hypothetical protein
MEEMPAKMVIYGDLGDDFSGADCLTVLPCFTPLDKKRTGEAAKPKGMWDGLYALG